MFALSLAKHRSVLKMPVYLFSSFFISFFEGESIFAELKHYTVQRLRGGRHIVSILICEKNRQNWTLRQIPKITIVFVLFFSFSSTSNAGMKIQFFGAKQDARRVRDALHKMVERGRVANITLVPSSLTFREEAVLQIEVCTSIHSLKSKTGQFKRDATRMCVCAWTT